MHVYNRHVSVRWGQSQHSSSLVCPVDHIERKLHDVTINTSPFSFSETRRKYLPPLNEAELFRKEDVPVRFAVPPYMSIAPGRIELDLRVLADSAVTTTITFARTSKNTQ